MKPNLTYINSLSGGDDSFKEKLISVIKLEFPVEKATYIKNIEAKNYQIAAENVHKLKHKISILGLEESYKIAACFEKNLKENSMTLKEDFENILQTITNYLIKL
ncbi:Hpt domain-containing protein [uncultured Algibacter sp.]|uniref:Hpt domain-containing protein n=1 Tax=uncultured Algibacter sp. TaxID=298659 RepID=UPI00321770C0